MKKLFFMIILLFFNSFNAAEQESELKNQQVACITAACCGSAIKGHQGGITRNGPGFKNFSAIPIDFLLTKTENSEDTVTKIVFLDTYFSVMIPGTFFYLTDKGDLFKNQFEATDYLQDNTLSAGRLHANHIQDFALFIDSFKNNRMLLLRPYVNEEDRFILTDEITLIGDQKIDDCFHASYVLKSPKNMTILAKKPTHDQLKITNIGFIVGESSNTIAIINVRYGVLKTLMFDSSTPYNRFHAFELSPLREDQLVVIKKGTEDSNHPGYQTVFFDINLNKEIEDLAQRFQGCSCLSRNYGCNTLTFYSPKNGKFYATNGIEYSSDVSHQKQDNDQDQQDVIQEHTQGYMQGIQEIRTSFKKRDKKCVIS